MLQLATQRLSLPEISINGPNKKKKAGKGEKKQEANTEKSNEGAQLCLKEASMRGIAMKTKNKGGKKKARSRIKEQKEKKKKEGHFLCTRVSRNTRYTRYTRKPPWPTTILIATTTEQRFFTLYRKAHPIERR